MKKPRGRDFVNERRHAESLTSLHPGGKPDLRERALDEILETRQAAAQHRSGIAIDGDRSALQCVEGEERTIEEVPKLVSRVPATLDFLLGPPLCREPRVLCHCFSDRRVEASVQRMKFFDGDRRVLLDRDLGDDLADITVVVNDLRHVEARR